MHTETVALPQLDRQPADPWFYLAGASVGLVIGFGIDLFRLGVHEAKRALAARFGASRTAARGWYCQGPCDADAR